MWVSLKLNCGKRVLKLKDQGHLRIVDNLDYLHVLTMLGETQKSQNSCGYFLAARVD